MTTTTAPAGTRAHPVRDVLTARPGRDGATLWRPIGTAYPAEDGSMAVSLHALPTPDKDGRIWLKIAAEQK